MRHRLLRRAILGLSLLAVVLLAATSAAWIRSEFAYDAFWGRSVDPATRHYFSPVVAFDRGHCTVIVRAGVDASGRAASVIWHRQPSASMARDPRGSMAADPWFSFVTSHDPTGPNRQDDYRLRFRFAPVAVVLACGTWPFVVWLYRRRRRRRHVGFSVSLISRCWASILRGWFGDPSRLCEAASAGAFRDRSPRHLHRRITMIAHYRSSMSRSWATAASIGMAVAATSVVWAGGPVERAATRPTGTALADPPYHIPEGFIEQPAIALDRIARPDPVPALQHERLGDVLDRLATGCKVTIDVDWDGLWTVGIERSTRLPYGPVREWRRPSFGAVLRHLLDDAEWAVPSPPRVVNPDELLDFTVVNGIVRVGLHGPLLRATGVDRTYDVASLLGDGPDRGGRADALKRYVQSRVARADWSDAPDHTPRLSVSAGVMRVCQPPDVQSQVVAILSRLNGEPPPADLSPDSNAETKRQLARRMPEVRFNQNALSDVVDFLRDTTDADIYVDWPELAKIGVTKETKASARLRGVSLGKALELILRGVQAGDDYDHRLAYIAGQGVITITSRRELDKDAVTRRYDVGDLLAGPVDPKVRLDEIVRYLTENVEPASWRRNGGAGQIQASQTLRILLVTQAEDRQAKVAEVLNALRERPATQP